MSYLGTNRGRARLSLDSVSGVLNRTLAPSATTVLLTHLDGSNGSTTFTDETARHTLTRTGAAVVSTGYSKFGGASLYCPSAETDILPFANPGADFYFTGNATIDFWAYCPSGGDRSLFIIGTGDYLGINYDAASQRVTLYINGGIQVQVNTIDLTTGFKHVAWTKNSTTVKLFINGVQLYSGTQAATLGFNNPPFARIGGGAASTPTYIDEFRADNGVSHFNANFAPFTRPYFIG